jgi:5-formyltetrahydrofolate cyclo-ligase
VTADLGRRRAEAIARRRSIDPGERARLSAAVVDRVIDTEWYRNSTTVGLYLAAGGEVDPIGLGEHIRARGGTTWYPIPAEGPMIFRHWDGQRPLVEGPLGIPAPPEAEECAGTDLDVVIVPLVLFGPDGVRVGRGGGHYDRTFAGRPSERSVGDRPQVLCGLAYDVQEDAELTPQSWDVALDVVITPSRTLTWRAAGSG